MVTLRRNTPSLLFLRKLLILEVLGCDRTDDHPTDGVVVVDCKVAETDVFFRRWASVTSRKPSSANISNALLIRTSRRRAPRRTSPSPAQYPIEAAALRIGAFFKLGAILIKESRHLSENLCRRARSLRMRRCRTGCSRGLQIIFDCLLKLTETAPIS